MNKQIKKNQSKFKYLLRKYRDAHEDYTFIGAHKVSEWKEINQNFTKCRRNLISFVLMFIKD